MKYPRNGQTSAGFIFRFDEFVSVRALQDDPNSLTLFFKATDYEISVRSAALQMRNLPAISGR